MLGEELRFAPEVYEERREAFSARLNAMIGYAVSDSECRSRMLLRYFDESDVAACGCCDVCLKQRVNRVGDEQLSMDAERVLSLLADGSSHSLSEVEALGLPRERLSAALRYLCDEERIAIEDGRVSAV